MIVNVRGTSGAGKSTLIRAITKQYPLVEKIFVPGRKQPLAYIYGGTAEHQRKSLAVLGHYESACGGCDTIGKVIPGACPLDYYTEELNSYHQIFGLVKHYHAQGLNVLFEGLLISGDVRHTKRLLDWKLPINVVAINIPVEECIASVLARRAAKGNTEPFNEKNTRDKHALLQKCLVKLKSAGVPVFDFAARADALLQVELLLGLA